MDSCEKTEKFSVGDIDSPDSFDYDVYYKVVPGLTYEVAQKGKMTPQVQERFLESIRWLIEVKQVKHLSVV